MATTIEIQAPALVRIGTKRTAILNLIEIATALDQDPSILAEFIATELGATYNRKTFSEDVRYIYDGRFQQKHFQNAIRTFIGGII